MYSEYTIYVEDKNISEILIALLSENSFDTFEEKENHLLAYIKSTDETQQVKEMIHQLSHDFKFTFTSKVYKDKNWNEEWEKNFQPIIVSNKVFIRAPFHSCNDQVLYELIIEPRMSFGTGHHASTYLMIETMLEYNFQGKVVCDVGCGTGILSIFSAILGAKEIFAIDNNEWAYKNTIDNQTLNHIGPEMSVEMNELKCMHFKMYDVILANINKPIIIENISLFKSCLNSGGILILSGVLLQDTQDIAQAAISIGFKSVQSNTKEDWICIVLNL